MTNPNGNLFDRSKAPSVKFPVIGTRHVIKVTDWPSLKDSKNFETGEIERWPNGDPKKIILVPGLVNGEAVALWVQPGTAMFAAIEKAQQDAGAEIAPGGTVTVTYTHDVPSAKGPHFAAAKQYSAQYAAPSAFAQAAAPAASPTQAASSAASFTPSAAAAAAVPAGVQAISAEQHAALSQVPGMDMSKFVVAAV